MKQRGSFFSKHWYLLAIIGLGFYVAYTEAYRFTMLIETPPADAVSGIAYLTAIALAAVVLVPATSKPLRLYENPFFIGIMSLWVAFDLYLRFVGIPGLDPMWSNALSNLDKIAEISLYVAFAEFFLELRPQQAVRAFGSALIIAGIIQLCASMLQRTAAIVFIIALGLLAAPLLFMAAKGWGNWSTDPGLFGSSGPDDEDFAEVENDHAAFVTLCISMVLFPFIFGSVHHNWVPLQDGGVNSLLIQISAACGTILAGNLILLVRKSVRSATFIDLCKDLILPVALVALYLSTFLTGTLSSAYIIVLNIAQKAALFLIWMTPFFYVTKRPPLQMAVILLLYYNVGKLLLNTLNLMSSSGMLSNFIYGGVIAAVMISLMVIALYSHLRTRALMRNQDAVAAGEEGDDTAEVETGNSTDTPGFMGFKRRYNRICDELAAAHGLTPRETQVFFRLAKGQTAERIARSMNVSVATVRTHINHVYQKMELSSQQALMDLVETSAEAELAAAKAADAASGDKGAGGR